MPPKGGMSILPTFIATTANPESMELAAAYFSGGPAALLGVVGVDDPSALASWPELGAPPSAAAVGRKDKKTPAASRDESPEPSAPKPPSEPTPPGRHGLYGAEERAAVEAAGGLRFVREHSLVCWRSSHLTPVARLQGVCNRVQCCCGYDDDDPWELGTIVALWYTEEDMSNDGEPCPEGTWFAAYQVRLDVGALIYAPSDTDDCVMAAPDDDDGGPGVDPRDFGWGGKFHHDGEDLGGPGGGPTLEATLIALAAGEDGRGAGLSPDDRAAGSPTYHPDDFQPVTGPNAMPVETQKRIAEHIAMNGGPFWMKGKSGQRATGPQEVDPVGQPKTSYVPNTQMLVKAAGVCVAAYFGECSVRLSVLWYSRLTPRLQSASGSGLWGLRMTASDAGPCCPCRAV